MLAAELVAEGDRRRAAAEWQAAADLYAEAAGHAVTPHGELAARLAGCYAKLGQELSALSWLGRVVEAPPSFAAWSAATALLRRLEDAAAKHATLTLRVAVVGSYTTAQFAAMLRLAALRERIWLELYEAPFDSYEQELLSPDSGTFKSKPEVVVLAVHEGALRLPRDSTTPDADVEAETARWTGLWERAQTVAGAGVVQHNFATRPEVPEGHLATRLAGSRRAMTLALNARIGEAAGDRVSIVDCERLSATLGKERWFDDRYWHLSRQATSLAAVPLLAAHTAAVIAARVGRSRRCLVLDLDNTLWGGIVGEDGVEGIELGGGPVGEAFVAFQEYVLALKAAGVVLAVASRNDDAAARAPFESHPDMRLSLDDFALFLANWDDKAANVSRIAQELDLALDALVFVDDDAANCARVREALPAVDVIALPADPAEYVTALARYPRFELASRTAEDQSRTELYAARAKAAELRASAETLDDYLAGLAMEAEIAPFDELHMPRIAQLVAKTNQFNLTTRRHSAERLQAFAADPACEHFYLRLRDRFGDHGLVGVLVAEQQGDAMEIDTWLISCRVVGRTVERTMFERLCRAAAERGCSVVRGSYIATERNGLVEDLYEQLGASLLKREGNDSSWEYDLNEQGIPQNPFIAATSEPRVHA